MHRREHEALSTVNSDTERRLAERVAQEFTAHTREHNLQSARWEDHLKAHEREHLFHTEAHEREHQLVSAALEKSERAFEQRLAATGTSIGQIREQQGRFATAERVDLFEKEYDRRLAEQSIAITNIEKHDVKGEGKSLGQGVVVAIIVAVIAAVGALSSLFILLADVFKAGAV
jgi:hypothetical protein